MVRVVCYIRPHRVEQVKSAIASLGVTGMTVSDARGTGNSPERSSWLGDESHLVVLPIKSKIEVVVPDELREALIEKIVENARTGEPGDGKIFVERLCDAIRVRTGERGDPAI